MRSHGSSTAFKANMLLVCVLVIAGIIGIVSGHALLGILLIGAGGVVQARAKSARAAHLHREKMTGLWQWAQGLGPRNKRGGRRSW
jgi:hypothetical protein